MNVNVFDFFNSITSSTYSSKKIINVGFENVKIAIEHPDTFVLINTLCESEQELLISNTLSSNIEEKTLNSFLTDFQNEDKTIIIYGKNSCDESVNKKYFQLVNLGFSKIMVYSGGLFEWMLLQDIYGKNEFPTTQPIKDILKFRPSLYLCKN